MFTIEKTGANGDKDRLIAHAALGEADFQAIADALGVRIEQRAKPHQPGRVTDMCPWGVS